MFRRLFFEDWVSLFPLVAFITAASVYATITYRAIRMKPRQVEDFSRLPFDIETHAASDATTDKASDPS